MGLTPTRYFSVWDNPNVNAPVFSIMGVLMLMAATFAILTKMGILDMIIDKNHEKDEKRKANKASKEANEQAAKANSQGGAGTKPAPSGNRAGGSNTKGST
jgi:hypothetical protein